jgi:hypothetical protein
MTAAAAPPSSAAAQERELPIGQVSPSRSAAVSLPRAATVPYSCGLLVAGAERPEITPVSVPIGVLARLRSTGTHVSNGRGHATS